MRLPFHITITIDRHWKAIAKHAWSLRFNSIGLVLQGLSVVMPLCFDRIPENLFWWFALATFLVTALSMASRFVPQKGIRH